jgi:hypothetical protein
MLKTGSGNVLHNVGTCLVWQNQDLPAARLSDCEALCKLSNVSNLEGFTIPLIRPTFKP